MTEHTERLEIEPDSRIVAMVIYKDRLFVATEHRVFERVDGVLRPLVFVRGDGERGDKK